MVIKISLPFWNYQCIYNEHYAGNQEYQGIMLKVWQNTYLAGEIPWSRRWFSQGEAYPLHSRCADPCNFPKCGKLDCINCGSGGQGKKIKFGKILWLWTLVCSSLKKGTLTDSILDHSQLSHIIVHIPSSWFLEAHICEMIRLKARTSGLPYSWLVHTGIKPIPLSSLAPFHISWTRHLCPEVYRSSEFIFLTKLYTL